MVFVLEENVFYQIDQLKCVKTFRYNRTYVKNNKNDILTIL